MKNFFIATMCVIFCNIVFPQTYYGKNDFGKLEFINDSMYVASFYSDNAMIFYDTGTYYKIEDTLFLNSKVKTAFVLEKISREEGYKMEDGNGLHYNIKFFSRPPELHGEYQMDIECVGCCILYDDINKEFKCPVSFCDDIIVIFDGAIYKRFLAKGDHHYGEYKIKITDDKMDRIYLDNFPLQIKKNKLIPIDKNKNEDCWINNGFYFPIMTRKSKDYEPDPRHNKTIRVVFRGIIGFYPGYDH